MCCNRSGRELVDSIRFIRGRAHICTAKFPRQGILFADRRFDLDSALQARLQEPRVLFELADDASEQVYRVGVGLLLTDATRRTAFDQVLANTLGQELHVLEIARGFLRVFADLRVRRDMASRAVGFRS